MGAACRPSGPKVVALDRNPGPTGRGGGCGRRPDWVGGPSVGPVGMLSGYEERARACERSAKMVVHPHYYTDPTSLRPKSSRRAVGAGSGAVASREPAPRRNIAGPPAQGS